MISVAYLLNFELISKSIYEYSVILLIFSLVMTDKYNAHIFYSEIIIGVLGMLANFLSGDRIVGLQFALALYIIYFQKKLSASVIMITVFIAIVFLSYSGSNRQDFAPFDIPGMINSLSVISERMMTLNTSYSAYFTSLRSLEYMEVITIAERVTLILHYLGSLVLGSYYPYEEANLAVYTFELGYKHSYGSYLPLLMYFYIDYVGVMLITYLMVRYGLKIPTTATTILSRVTVVYTASTFFRWYLYSPTMTLRGIILIMAIGLVIKLIGAKPRKYASKVY